MFVLQKGKLQVRKSIVYETVNYKEITICQVVVATALFQQNPCKSFCPHKLCGQKDLYSLDINMITTNARSNSDQPNLPLNLNMNIPVKSALPGALTFGTSLNTSRAAVCKRCRSGVVGTLVNVTGRVRC